MFLRKYIISDLETVPFENAIKVTSFELARGLFWELHWQQWALHNAKTVILFFNWVYIITFGPIIATTAILLYIKDRPKYFYYRNVVLLSFVFALVLFVFFPLAPPRFLPEYGFVDTIQKYGPSWWIGHSWYGSRDTTIYYNVFAAMPSLHFGWTVLFGVLFFRTKYLWLKVCGVIYPVMTFFAITLTGNHYILDAAGGAAVILASYLLYETLRRQKVHISQRWHTVSSYLSRAAIQCLAALHSWKGQAKSRLGTIRQRLMSRPSGLKRRMG